MCDAVTHARCYVGTNIGIGTDDEGGRNELTKKTYSFPLLSLK